LHRSPPETSQVFKTCEVYLTHGGARSRPPAAVLILVDAKRLSDQERLAKPLTQSASRFYLLTNGKYTRKGQTATDRCTGWLPQALAALNNTA
jgi:hypothetical protein